MFEDVLGINVQNFLRGAMVENLEQDRDEALNNMGIAFTAKAEPRRCVLRLFGDQLYLTDAAFDFCFGRLVDFPQGREFLAHLDDMAIALFPIVEKSKIVNQIINRGRLGHGLGIYQLDQALIH